MFMFTSRPQIPFDATMALNVIPQGDQFIRVQVIDAFVLVNPRPPPESPG